MKILTMFAVLFLIAPICSTFASGGILVDEDGDGFYCVLEDGENDGDAPVKFCNEDDQDRCDGIPNISLDDDHCSVDLNSDGYFTIDDIAYIKGLYPGGSIGNGDHLLAGLGDYNNFNAFYNRDYDFYTKFDMEIPVYHAWFGGHVCWFPMRVIEYNKRLAAAGLNRLQLDEPFEVIPYGSTHGCIRDFILYHVYPVIK